MGAKLHRESSQDGGIVGSAKSEQNEGVLIGLSVVVPQLHFHSALFVVYNI
uniref:Uncharacterized protein n=1 Tax=Anopheles quadriannulatus TaxID=34691 RepID=A0A182XR21_ANOQN